MDERENGGAEAEVWRPSEAGSHRGRERETAIKYISQSNRTLSLLIIRLS